LHIEKEHYINLYLTSLPAAGIVVDHVHAIEEVLLELLDSGTLRETAGETGDGDLIVEVLLAGHIVTTTQVQLGGGTLCGLSGDDFLGESGGHLVRCGLGLGVEVGV